MLKRLITGWMDVQGEAYSIVNFPFLSQSTVRCYISLRSRRAHEVEENHNDSIIGVPFYRIWRVDLKWKCIESGEAIIPIIIDLIWGADFHWPNYLINDSRDALIRRHDKLASPDKRFLYATRPSFSRVLAEFWPRLIIHGIVAWYRFGTSNKVKPARCAFYENLK